MFTVRALIVFNCIQLPVTASDPSPATACILIQSNLKLEDSKGTKTFFS